LKKWPPASKTNPFTDSGDRGGGGFCCGVTT
jgi:hypothetical protein